LKYFLIDLFLLIDQTSLFSTVYVTLSLSLFSSYHSNNKWSFFWSLVPQAYVGVSIILNRCKYDLIKPCHFTMFVKVWIVFIFIFKLSATTGMYYFVISSFVVLFQSLCYYSTFISPSSLITTIFENFL